MIIVSKATKKDTKDWSKKEWHKVDFAHYGKSVEWNEQKFRFKATEDGKLVGFLYGKHESGVIYISSIITAENARGKGIGTMLISKSEEVGKKLGAHKMWLITGKKWSENAFYQKVGFKIIGTLPDFHFHEDFVIYSKNIR
jgi:ribosomal protein S18 acetylase RimI-like enzyme